MQIKIDDYIVVSDKRQYVVGKPSLNKDGNQIINSARYFTSLGGVANYLIHQKINKSDVQNLQELARLIASSAIKIQKSLNGFKFNIDDRVSFDFTGDGELIGKVYGRDEELPVKTRYKKDENPFSSDKPVYTYTIMCDGQSYSLREHELEKVE